MSTEETSEPQIDPALSRQISAYLDRHGLQFAVQDGVHVVPFQPSSAGAADSTPALVVLIWAGPAAANGVMVELHSPALPTSSDVDELLRQCNAWNVESRASKARLHTEPAITVVFEAWMPVPRILADDVLHDFLDAALRDLGTTWPVVEAQRG